MTTRPPAARLLRSFIALGVGNYGAMAVSLAINALLTRRLGVEAFGHLALLLMGSQVLSLLAVNWTHAGAVRFGAQAFASAGSIAEAFWTRVWIVTPWALAGAVAMLVARHPLASYLGIPPWGLLVVLGHFLATLGLNAIGAAFQARSEMSRYGAALFLDKAVMAGFILAAPVSLVRDPLSVLTLYAFSSSVVALVGLRLLGLRALRPVVFDRAACQRMLAFSLPLVLSSWAGLLGTNWFDFVVIKWYRPVSDVGLYSLGTSLASVVQQVTIIFSTLLLPQLSIMVARGEQERIKALVERVLPYWFLGTSILFSVVVLSAGWVVPLVFGSAFQPSVMVLAILMPAACALALFNAFSPLVSAMGSTWTLTGICLASGLVNVAMDFALIPWFGIAGAAVSTVLAYGTSAVLVLSFVHSQLKGGVLSLSLLALPAALVSACFVAIDGAWFYAVATPALVASAYWLARHFRLFRAGDAQFLDDLRLSAWLTNGLSLALTKKS